jgi:hypothetical protein
MIPPASIGTNDADSTRLPPLSPSQRSSLCRPHLATLSLPRPHLATSLSLPTNDSLLALLHGDVPPNDRQHAAGERHPDDADGRGHARDVIPEVQLGKEESERRGLHGRLDGHCAGLHLPETGELRQPVPNDAPGEMEEEDGDLRTVRRESHFYCGCFRYS